MAYTVDLRKKAIVPEPKPAEESAKEVPVAKGTIEWTTSLSQIPNKKAAGAVTAALIIAAAGFMYFQHEYMFGILLLLSGCVLTISSFKQPEHHKIQINAAGIVIQDRKYFFHEIKSFWINYQPHQSKELILQFKKRFTPMLRIPLGGVSPLEVRTAMISLVLEKEYEETFVDMLIRNLMD